MGNGNVGASLNPLVVNTYMSRNAGLNWTLVGPGPYDFAIGDYGSLTLMAKTQEETSSFIFSGDEGLSWEKCTFSSSPIFVHDILEGSSSKSLNFIVYGVRTDNKTGVLLTLNFSNYFPRQCSSPQTAGQPDSDYELWSPKSFDSSCILGQQEVFVRKKQSVNCSNGQDYTIMRSINSCPCTEDDFQCGVGYKLNSERKCVVDPTSTVERDSVPVQPPPDNCDGSRGYFVAGAYQLVEGTKCNLETGKNLLEHRSCPMIATTIGKIALSTLLIISFIGILIAIFIVLFYKNSKFREYWRSKFPSLFRPPGPDYNSLLNENFGDAEEQIN